MRRLALALALLPLPALAQAPIQQQGALGSLQQVMESDVGKVVYDLQTAISTAQVAEAKSDNWQKKAGWWEDACLSTPQCGERPKPPPAPQAAVPAPTTKE